VVCGQQRFSTSALNTFTGVDIQTFEQRAGDVVIWNRHALDLNRLDAQMSPAEPGCTGVPADFLDPVRARLPTFLADVRQALALLDPTVAADYSQLFGVRFADMLNLAADFGLVGADDLESATFGVIVTELVRVRDAGYSQCRLNREQTVQSKLLKEALLSEARSPFQRDDVLKDVQFCGMPLHWKLIDIQGVVLQQGVAGGTGPGATIASVALQASGAAKVVFSGPVSALVCPVGAQNNEQLAFSAGPAAGPFGIVKQLSPSNANGYLESSTLDIDVQPLLQQGAKRLVVARQGGLCNGTFINLSAHATLAAFSLVTSSLNIVAPVLPDAVIGTFYSATLTATGGVAPLAWRATGLPAGLSLDSASGVVSGVPTASGSVTIAVQVSDAAGSSDSDSASITVGSPALDGTWFGDATDTTTNRSFSVQFVMHTRGNRMSLGGFLVEVAADGTLTFLGTTSPGDLDHFTPLAETTISNASGTLHGTIAQYQYDSDDQSFGTGIHHIVVTVRRFGP
jgi:hypothetical protein